MNESIHAILGDQNGFRFVDINLNLDKEREDFPRKIKESMRKLSMNNSKKVIRRQNIRAKTSTKGKLDSYFEEEPSRINKKNIKISVHPNNCSGINSSEIRQQTKEFRKSRRRKRQREFTLEKSKVSKYVLSENEESSSGSEIKKSQEMEKEARENIANFGEKLDMPRKRVVSSRNVRMLCRVCIEKVKINQQASDMEGSSGGSRPRICLVN